jgi:serine/threonine protein kinase
MPEESWPAPMRLKSRKMVAGLEGALRGDSLESRSRAPTPLPVDLTAKTGSLAYMAPEVMLGRPYGEKADTFSFAMLMYNLFVRCVPLSCCCCTALCCTAMRFACATQSCASPCGSEFSLPVAPSMSSPLPQDNPLHPDCAQRRRGGP